MSESRARRIDARPATQEVTAYRALVSQSSDPSKDDDPTTLATQLVELCRFRNRPALLRANLRFGRSLTAIRVADLDGDGLNELIVVDSDRIIHTLKLQPGAEAPRSLPPLPSGPVLLPPTGARARPSDPYLVGVNSFGPTWLVATHRYHGRMLGLQVTPFGVFRRQEAILTSVEDHTEGERYFELKITCDGQGWEKSELLHRGAAPQIAHLPSLLASPSYPPLPPYLQTPQTAPPPSATTPRSAGGRLRLIGESGDSGRVPVLRQDEGQLYVEVLDDRQPRGADGTYAVLRVQLPPGEVTQVVLCGSEVVVAYSRGGLLPVGMDGLIRPMLFPDWRFSCLAYASSRMLGEDPSGPGLLVGGTTSGYVFAIDPSASAVLWRLDAGFLFSSLALGDVESSGRVDLLIGGIDGGLRVYELTDNQLLESRCVALYRRLGGAAAPELWRLAPPGSDPHAPVQTFLLSRILESTGTAQTAVVELVNWFTSGRPGWHSLPERAQQGAVMLLERFLLTYLPIIAGESRATATGPLPILMEGTDPKTSALLTRAILAELVEVYLAAPRLVRRQIDRISRRLVEQYWRLWQPDAAPLTEGSVTPLQELTRLLNVRGLRAREYAHQLLREAEATLARYAALPAALRPVVGEDSEVLMRILRAIGLLEEARIDRFTMESERLDLSLAVLEPLPDPRRRGPDARRRGVLVVGIDRNGVLRVEAQPPPVGPSLKGPRPRDRGTPPLGMPRFHRGDEDGSAVPVPVDLLEDEQEATLTGGHPTAPPRGQGAPAVTGPITAGGLEWPRTETFLPAGSPRFIEARYLCSGPFGDEPALLVGVEERGRTHLLLYLLSDHAVPELCSDAWVGPGAEPIGFDHGSDTDPADTPREVLLLRLPVSSEREGPAVLAVDAPGAQLRVREHLFPEDLLAATAVPGLSLHVTSSRVTLRPARGLAPGLSRALSLSAPAGCRCCALSPDGRLLAVGTANGLVQVFQVGQVGQQVSAATPATPASLKSASSSVTGGARGADSLRLKSQHLLHKGISALCFLPTEIFGVGALAVGTEEEQVPIFAVDFGDPSAQDDRREGEELARLSAGGTPLRMSCQPLDCTHADAARPAYRLSMMLSGGVISAWDSPSAPEAPVAIRRLLDLGARAVGSRHRVLSAALRAPGPHTRAVAMGEVLREAEEQGTAQLLQIARYLLAPTQSPGAPPPYLERNHIVLRVLCEALLPVALRTRAAPTYKESEARGARELIQRAVYLCDEPLAIRAALLSRVEQELQGPQVPELLSWLPPLILTDPRSATWPFSTDSVAALLQQHLRRLERARLFEEHERELFHTVAQVLEAMLPSQPSRFLLTEVALLLRSALSWDRSTWAGDLGRARLYLPHSVIEVLCQPTILPDGEARAFLLGVSRRWGPRLPFATTDEGGDQPLAVTVGLYGSKALVAGASGGMAMLGDAEPTVWLDAAVDCFDMPYYERLATELTRFTRPAGSGEEEPDTWALADTLQAVLRLFSFSSLNELWATLQTSFAERSLSAIRSHRGHKRDEAWGFLDEDAYQAEREALYQRLQSFNRKSIKAQQARELLEVHAELDDRRNKLGAQIVARIMPSGVAGEDEALSPLMLEERLLRARPMATVVGLMTAWMETLDKEAVNLGTEADFEVVQVADLGVTDGWRTVRWAVRLAPSRDPRERLFPRGVLLTVRATDPPELRARPVLLEPLDLEPGRELAILIEAPGHLAAAGRSYRVELEINHDAGKRTERWIEGQFARDSRPVSRAFLDSFEERLPTAFQRARRLLDEHLEPHAAAVALVTAFPSHAYELLASALSLEWPDRPVDSVGAWRMINVAARPAQGPGSGGGHSGTPSLRDALQLIGARLGQALGLPEAERLDTVEALVRAVSEASPYGPGGTAPGPGVPRGLLILGLPELLERTRLEDGDLRQLLSLGARLCLCYRGRALAVLSPAAAALSLGLAKEGAGGGALELIDLDHVADPLSPRDDKARLELERALTEMLGAKEGSPQIPVMHALVEATGTDLRLVVDGLPLVESALRERGRVTGPGAMLLESKAGSHMMPLWAVLPPPHRLYLAALASDSVELELGDLKPGMIIDAPVHSISGRDRQPTSKIVFPAGTRLDARSLEELSKVMWLRKVRVRGSLQDSRTVLWTYLRQPRPPQHGPKGSPAPPHGSGERWLDVAAADLRRLGLVRSLRLPGDRHFHAFSSPVVRDWLRGLLGLGDGEAGLPNTADGRNLVRQLSLWDAAVVDRTLGGNSAALRAVLGLPRQSAQQPGRWQDFLELSRACRKWVDDKEESRFIEAIAKYFRLDVVDGTARDIHDRGAPKEAVLRCVSVRFRDQRQLPWLKRVVLYLPLAPPDLRTLDLVQQDVRTRRAGITASQGGSGPLVQKDAVAGESVLSDASLSAIVVVPELTTEVAAWSQHLFYLAAIDVADLQHAALHDNPGEELIRRLAAAASYEALSPFRSKMGLANQELIEEMFYGRRALLEEIRGQRQENFIIVGPRKIGKTSLLQRVRLELERHGYRVIPRGMDYTTAPSSHELLRGMLTELLEDLEPGRHGHHFGLAETLPSLRQVVDQWSQRFPERSLAIVLDEIDTILRTERRAYLLGEGREATVLGEALQAHLPGVPVPTRLEPLAQALRQTGFSADVVEGILRGLLTPPQRRREPALLEELRSASALALKGSAVCRVILAGHAELSEARSDLFGPLLNFAKLRFLGPLDELSAERMVREPFARLGLRFENAGAEQLLLQQTFRVPAWIQYCGALIVRSIDERLRTSRREEQKITERDVQLALEKIHTEERGGLMSENGNYQLGPECAFVLLTMAEESWFTIDGAVEFLKIWYELLEPNQRVAVCDRERDFVDAFSAEVVRRIVRDMTNTFYLNSDEAAGQGQGMVASTTTLVPGLGLSPAPRDRLRRTYKVNAPMVRIVFRDELLLVSRIELARRAMQLYREGQGVWGRTAQRSGQRGVL